MRFGGWFCVLADLFGAAFVHPTTTMEITHPYRAKMEITHAHQVCFLFLPFKLKQQKWNAVMPIVTTFCFCLLSLSSQNGNHSRLSCLLFIFALQAQTTKM